MKHLIVCPEIKNNLFTIVYLRMNNIPISLMNLLPYRQIHRIGNNQLINQIKNNFNSFTESNLTLASWFKVNILIGEQRNDPADKAFMLKPTKFDFEKVLVKTDQLPWYHSTMISIIKFISCKTILVLSKRKTYYYEYDYKRIKAKSPIKIHIKKLLQMYNLPIDGIEDFQQYAFDNQIDLNCYKLHKIMKFACLDHYVTRKYHGSIDKEK